MKKLLAVLGLGAVCAFPAYAQFAKTEDAVKYRKAAFTLMGNHMGRLSAMVKGQVPFDAAKAQESARVIEFAGKLPWEGFVPGTAGDLKADPSKEAAHFKQLADDSQAEIAKLVTAAATLDGLKGQLGKTGGSCKACHDDFRK